MVKIKKNYIFFKTPVSFQQTSYPAFISGRRPGQVAITVRLYDNGVYDNAVT